VKGGKKLGSLIKKVKAIAAGGTGTILQPSGGHSLALVAQGEVFGWGWNVKGQLGLQPARGSARARQRRADIDGTRPQSR
jgi:alpha-tubulin suppressor-like RCC1 family protein